MFRSYLTTLSTVLTSALGYRQLLQSSLTSALVFFIVSLVALSLSSSLRFNVRLLPQVRVAVEHTLTQIQTSFPENFTAAWDGSYLKLSGTPVTVPYPDFVNSSDWLLPAGLAQIEVAEPENSTLETSNTLLYLTETKFYVQNSQDQWVDFPISDFLTDQPPFLISRATAPDLIANGRPLIQETLTFLSYLLYLLLPVWMIFSRLWEVLFNSLFLFFFLRLDGTRWPWRKVFQLGLYLAVPAEIIYQVTAWLYPQVNLPMFSLSFWVIAIVVYLSPKLAKLKA